MKVPPVKLAPSQKVKTWKFAGKFLWKNAHLYKDKAELGRWTKEGTPRTRSDICKVRSDRFDEGRPISTGIYKRTGIPTR